MAYKNIAHDFSFADIAVQKFADKNRSMLFLHQVSLRSINATQGPVSKMAFICRCLLFFLSGGRDGVAQDQELHSQQHLKDV